MHPLEVKTRQKLKSGKIKPTPAGVLVVGRMPGVDIPVRAHCKDHLFQTREAEKSDAWQSGWKQAARCVVCRDEIPAIDASWWVQKATVKDIHRCMKYLKKRAERDRSTHSNLKKRLALYEEED